MTRKRTPFDIALWATLPMAHTSKVEGRIKMVLDSTRRRTSPRRFLLLAAVTGAAALIPLSMLEPIVRAQNGVQPRPANLFENTIQLVYIWDAAMPNSAGWDVTGKQLPVSSLNSYRWQANTRVSAKPGQKVRFFAFHLSKPMQNVPLIYSVSNTTRDSIVLLTQGDINGSSPEQVLTRTFGPTVTVAARSIQLQVSHQTLIYGAAFSLSLAQTDIQVGRVLGPWTTARVVPLPFQGECSVANSNGSRFQPTTFHLTHGKIVFSTSVQTLDNFQNLRLFASDKQGHWTLLRPVVVESRNNPEQIIERLPQGRPPLNELRIETRPVAWTEFKDVALQPVR